MRRWGGGLVGVLLLLGAAAPTSAAVVTPGAAGITVDGLLKTSVTWTQRASGPALVWDATAFAASTGQLVQLGGTTGYATASGLRLYSPVTDAWTTVAAPRRGWPSAKTSAKMAWDPVHQRVVLFGGRDEAGVALRETWTFNPATRAWTQAAANCRTAACPPARWGHAMVWSSALSRVLLFGGIGPGTGPAPEYNDVWAFDGAVWTKLATANAPAARYLHGMAEDPVTGQVVVFGGIAHTTGQAVDAWTWVLDPRTRAWQRLVTATVPVPRAEVGMAWLGSVGAVVIATGGDGQTCMSWTSSVWAFDPAAGDWRQLTTGGGTPTPRNTASLTANPIDGSAILIGGTGDNQLPPTMVDRAWVLR